jgi:class 3 adenylate cyclase
MASPQATQSEGASPESPASRRAGLIGRSIHRRPFLWLFFVVVGSNASGSIFNILYNTNLVVERLLDPGQRRAFETALLIYNAVAYPLGLSAMWYLFWPLSRCRNDLLANRPVAPRRLDRCRRRMVRLPIYALCISLAGWLPGAAVFPLIVCWLGGMNAANDIWLHFGISFLVSTLLTTAQTFFLVELFLIHFLYRDVFQDARPADVKGVVPFAGRLALLWLAVAIAPLSAMLVVAWNLTVDGEDSEGLLPLAISVAVVGAAFGGLVFWIVGLDVIHWLRLHYRAIEQVDAENFEHRIPGKRPDEFGRLTDAFNEMTVKQGRAKVLRETFGQIVHPEVRDELLERFQGLGGEVQEVSVLFADIRGFTRRSTGESPERIVELLNRFLTIGVAAVEENDGFAKFLGDGFMALFNVRRARADHVDQAVAAATDLLARLRHLNAELESQGKEPLVVGIGIHAGPALVGCIGAKVPLGEGQVSVRKELTAIGETINLGKRLEQLTKVCGGPVLLSEQARARLKRDVPVVALGPQRVEGCADRMVVYQIVSDPPAGGSDPRTMTDSLLLTNPDHMSAAELS